MQTISRLKRMAWALLVGLALVIVGYGLYVFTFLASAVAFSGSAGARHAEFFSGLAPIALAVGLAAMAGWGVYFLNALATTKGWWLKSIALAAVLGCTTAIANPHLARRLSSAPLAVVNELYSSYAQGQARDEAAFEARLLEYVATHQAVLSAAGGMPKASVFTKTTRRGSKAVEYAVSVAGERTIYAIVLADSVDGNAKLTLACVTDLSIGQRDASKDACAVPIGSANR